MNQPAVQVQQIGKEYTLGLREKSHQTFREAMVELAKAPLRRLRHLSGGSDEGRFWALRDVSFDVPDGEVLGIVGHNGAGKSTLLKILSRITEPTEGRAIVRGRVASLLEVGTGFHTELTGRENVYLNGAILGMSHAEIDRKFDEIVDFAGIEQFLDTPIKRYSSGMKVRLAFAVAAHLEPEILIIDEVLAVGDQEFQNKCLGKMNEVATSGRTVLFVSHNMAAVEALCSRCLLLDHGRIVDVDAPDRIISLYLQHARKSEGTVDLQTHLGRKVTCTPVLSQFRIMNSRGDTSPQIGQGEDVIFQVDVTPQRPIRPARLAIRIFDAMGMRITTCHTEYQHPRTIELWGPSRLSCLMKDCRLAPGQYSIDLQFDEGRQVIDKIDAAASFEVIPRDLYGTGRSFPAKTAIFYPVVEWSIAQSEQAAESPIRRTPGPVRTAT